MKRNSRKTARLTSSCTRDILAECRALLEKHDFAEEETDSYLENVTSVLDSYREHFGEDTQIEYRVLKRFRRIVLRLVLRGEKFNPLQAEKESGTTGQSVQRELNPLVWNRTNAASHTYLAGANVISIASPYIHARAIHRSPMLWAAVSGLLCGLLCLYLPEAMRNVIVEDIARPVQDLTLGLLTGVMGPVVLFSMITAVSALKSINDLTDLGFKLVGRFIVITLAVMAVGVGVSLLFYSVFGEGGTDLELGQVVELVLGVIPTNVLAPLLETNVPQLVVLGVALGAALLMLENKVDGLKEVLTQIHEWIMSLMGMVLVIAPVIPFMCIFLIVAQGSAADLLNGWEFIVAAYLAATICGALKLAKVSIKYKVGPGLLWRKLKPMVADAFASGNCSTMLKMEYEISERDLGIKPEFASFWIPMSQAMLNPRSTLLMVIPPFLILKYTGMPISTSFLLVLIILVLELSIANPGTTGGWTILFAALGFPPEYLGMFLTYRLACKNYNAAYGALQAGLEHIESADRFDALDLDRLRDSRPAA